MCFYCNNITCGKINLLTTNLRDYTPSTGRHAVKKKEKYPVGCGVGQSKTKAVCIILLF